MHFIDFLSHGRAANFLLDYFMIMLLHLSYTIMNTPQTIFPSIKDSSVTKQSRRQKGTSSHLHFGHDPTLLSAHSRQISQPQENALRRSRAIAISKQNVFALSPQAGQTLTRIITQSNSRHFLQLNQIIQDNPRIPKNESIFKRFTQMREKHSEKQLILTKGGIFVDINAQLNSQVQTKPRPHKLRLKPIGNEVEPYTRLISEEKKAFLKVHPQMIIKECPRILKEQEERRRNLKQLQKEFIENQNKVTNVIYTGTRSPSLEKK